MTPLLEALGEVGSTNDELRARLEAGAPSGSAVWASSQTAGRGRLGRTWFSPPHRNIYLSVGVRIVGPRQRAVADRLPLAAGVGAARAIEAVAPVRVGLKWPNDLELDGRKLGGILCEGVVEQGELQAVIIGIGVNANLDAAELPAELADRATSLLIATGRTVDLASLAAGLRTAIEAAATELLEGNPAATVQAFAERDCLAGRAVRHLQTPTLVGTADGVDGQGRLRVVYPDGSVATVAAGEVELMR